jgi:hypothetical protein
MIPRPIIKNGKLDFVMTKLCHCETGLKPHVFDDECAELLERKENDGYEHEHDRARDVAEDHRARG